MPEQLTVRLAYDFNEAAAWLGPKVKAGTVRNLVESGRLRTTWVGRHLEIPHSELVRYLEQQLEAQKDTA